VHFSIFSFLAAITAVLFAHTYHPPTWLVLLLLVCPVSFSLQMLSYGFWGITRSQIEDITDLAHYRKKLEHRLATLNKRAALPSDAGQDP
jgi:hypothetical protein